MKPIVDKVNALQQEIKDLYGVESHIQIHIHSRTPEQNKELANYIAQEVAGNINPEEIMSYANYENNGVQWVGLQTRLDMSLAAYYEA